MFMGCTVNASGQVHRSKVSKIPVIKGIFGKCDFLYCCDGLLLVSGAVGARGPQGQQSTLLVWTQHEQWKEKTAGEHCGLSWFVDFTHSAVCSLSSLEFSSGLRLSDLSNKIKLSVCVFLHLWGPNLGISFNLLGPTVGHQRLKV